MDSRRLIIHTLNIITSCVFLAIVVVVAVVAAVVAAALVVAAPEHIP